MIVKKRRRKGWRTSTSYQSTKRKEHEKIGQSSKKIIIYNFISKKFENETGNLLFEEEDN